MNAIEEIRIYDDKIIDVATKISDKFGISKEKAKSEIEIGVMLGLLMNRHKIQENQENTKI